MQFDPKTEKELAESNLWNAGIYSFEILEKSKIFGKEFITSDTKSSKGNDMIQLAVAIYNDEGQIKVLPDYLLAALAHKLRHAAYACGIGNQYESGMLIASDFIGKTGHAQIEIQAGGKKENGEGNHPDKNTIKDYVVSDDYQQQRSDSRAKSAPVFDDDIPSFA